MVRSTGNLSSIYITCFYVNFIIIHNIFVKDVTIVLLCNIVGL